MHNSHTLTKGRPRFKLGSTPVGRVAWAKVAWDAALRNELLKLQRKAHLRVAQQRHAAAAPTPAPEPTFNTLMGKGHS